MYFQSIDINNYGSVKDFHYSFRFDENGFPIPLVLIGENGTGKTLTVANMVDALIEIKRKTFGETLYEVKEHNYYKIGSKNYITNGQNTSRVVICLNHGEESLKYTDIMSNDPAKIAEDQFVEPGDIHKRTPFDENGFYRNTVSSLKKKQYSDFITLFFPVDRFYLPLWYNNENYKRIDYSGNLMVNQPDTNLIKADILSNIQEWLTLVYLQTTLQILILPDDPSIPENMRGKTAHMVSDTSIQAAIKKAMNAILGTNDYQPRVPNRKNKMISFSATGIDCKDISQLSEGQMSLLAIALSIIKEWDISHEGFELGDISGCVIIDEADLGLHINYMYNCFPRLMQLFPKVQFILTTHSPFMLAGLIDKLGGKVDILTMPEGIKISDINLFSEVQKAQELVFSGINQIREEDKQLKEEVTQLRQMQERIVLYTEGTTDVLLLEKAIEKLNITDLPLEIHTASQNHGKHSDEAIKKLLAVLQENPCVNNTVIGLFDRDATPAVEFIDSSGSKRKLVEYEFVKLGNHVYAFALPVPHNRPETDQISIEHFFTDEEIMTENEDHQRLFLGKEFYPSGNHVDDSKDYNYRKAHNVHGTIRVIEHEQNAYVTDRKGNGDFSLSKQHFAEAIRDGRPGFEQFDFSEFRKIFDVIRKILAAEQGEQA